MNTKSKIMALVIGITLALSTAQAWAGEENTFKAIGKITESRNDHTTKHEHELNFVRLSDGETFDIVDSPQLVKEHCETEKNSVVEVEGYRTGKFLFWGGNLVVTNFKVHSDIEVPKMAHLSPAAVQPTRTFNDRR
jgi:hypothetical protein